MSAKRKTSGHAPTVGLVSLGCAKNAVDLQVMAGHLLAAGFEIAPDPARADVQLVNTCAFIEEAREEAADEILRACELKAKGACRAVVVSGCFAQRYGMRLPELFPDVDAWVGIDALDRIAGVVQSALSDPGQVYFDVDDERPCRVFDPPVPELRFTSRAFAYLKIAEGCAHRCAYCAIPAIRGRYRSRTLPSLVAEAKALLASGVKEINVIAQDPMLWGVDFPAAEGRPKATLVTLLKALDGLEGDFWLRVLYSYPSEITDEYVEWLNTSPHAVKYVDVPLQHTDPGVLKAMARGAAAKAKAVVGRALPALVVAEGVARLESQAPEVDGVVCLKPSARGAPPAVGEFVQVEIEAVKGFDFVGRVL